MNFNLSDQPTFHDLKQWVLDNQNDFPDNLRSVEMYYIDPKFTANVLIEGIETRVEFCKENNLNIKSDRIAKTNKTLLFKLYKALQNKENWNLGLQQYEPEQNT